MRKELIVIQQDLKDCGICCLQSIIKYYHGYVPLEKLRIDTATSLEGTSAYQLIKAAKSYGFDAVGKRLNDISDLNEKIIYPCIAHIKTETYNHFVVIYKVVLDRLLIMDPAKGKVIIPKNEFTHLFTKIIIELYPKRKILNIQSNKYLSKITLKLFQNNYSYFIKIFILKLGIICLSLFLSFHFKINTLIYNDNSLQIFKLITIYFFLGYFLKIGFNYLEKSYKNIFEKNIDQQIHNDFLNRLFLLPNTFIKNRTTGEIITRIEELTSIKELYSNILLETFLESILVLISLITLFNINRQLFYVLCLFLVIYILGGTIFSKRIFQKIINNIEISSIFKAKIIENIDVYNTIKNLGVTTKVHQELIKMTDNYLTDNYKLNDTFIKFNTFSDICEEALTFFLISFGFLMIFHKAFNIIDLYTFLILISYPLNFIKNLIIIIPKFNYIKASIHKIKEYFEIPLENNNNLDKFTMGNIKVENLTYALSPKIVLFQNLNLEIKMQTHVMLKGPSGSGKSTLCKLIAGIITESNLPITIANKSISNLSRQSIRENITYVGQSENLIQDNIKNNILFYRNIPDEKLKKIISLCYLEDVILKKPMGLETFIFKDTLNFSGGEKQRIILARALLNDFQILILDEALSELNENLEIKIINNLREYFNDKTIIYVTHKNHDSYFDQVIDITKQRTKEV